MKKNDIITAEITGYTSEGLGVAKPEGGVVFVAGAARGDRCELRITKALPALAYGKIERLLAPSPERTEPLCRARGCGGCDFQHISYEEELRFKKQRVEDALKRIGGIETGVSELIGASRLSGYRNKAVFNFGLKNGSPVCGFYRERSHEVVPATECLIQSPLACESARQVMRWAKENNVSIYDETRHEGLLRHLSVRTAADGRRAAVCLSINGDSVPMKKRLVSSLPFAETVALDINTRRGNSVMGGELVTLSGRGYLTDTLMGHEFHISPASFYQVNHEQTERLYSKALELADIQPHETALDLYCGIGTITLCLAERARRAVGAEIVPQAVVNAADNARVNGIENAEFICADALEAFRELKTADVVVVDPPRKGLARGVIDSIVSLAPSRVVYVSCDCATLARDLRIFSEQGYKTERIAAVDLFPRTRHVETVALMRRASL